MTKMASQSIQETAQIVNQKNSKSQKKLIKNSKAMASGVRTNWRVNVGFNTLSEIFFF